MRTLLCPASKLSRATKAPVLFETLSPSFNFDWEQVPHLLIDSRTLRSDDEYLLKHIVNEFCSFSLSSWGIFHVR